MKLLFQRKSARHVSVSTLFILLLGCATTGEMPTQSAINQANKICEDQVNTDQGQRNPKWFTRWLECKKSRVMPFDIALYPAKEKEIRAMYDRLIYLGANVDMGFSRVEEVYAEWDKMQRDIKMKGCLIRLNAADGSSRCAPTY